MVKWKESESLQQGLIIAECRISRFGVDEFFSWREKRPGDAVVIYWLETCDRFIKNKS